MFHMLEKEHAEEVDKKAAEQYRKRCNEVLAHSKVLYKTRQEAMEQLKACDAYMQALTNCPAEFGRTGKTIQKGYQDFEKELEKIQKKAEKRGKGSVDKALTMGTAAGAGAGLFGADLMLAAATTFGTTAAGVSISSLSGAAATNAILAWLGGGTLAAGGAGVVGGEILLSLVGPVGIGCAIVCLVAKGVKVNIDNKNQALNAEKDAKRRMEALNRLNCIDQNVDSLLRKTKAQSKTVSGNIAVVKRIHKSDYSKFSDREAEQLRLMLNNAQTLASLVTEKVSLKN
jgi:hypothetical protein